MSIYRVRLINELEDFDKTIEVADDVYIADAAAQQDIELPISCQVGSCSTCTGKLLSGIVDQGDQSYLDDAQMNAGFVLTCVAYAASDCTIRIKQEDALI